MLHVSSRRRRRCSSVVILVCLTVVAADVIRHHSADASETDVVKELTQLGNAYLDKDENELVVAAKELAEKSSDTAAAKKHDVGNALSVNVKATPRRTDRVTVLPWSADTDAHLVSLMLDVTRRVAALQEVVSDMRQENKLNYRQLRRHLMRLATARSLNNANRQTDFDSGPRSFVQSAAFHVDRPQADQHEQPDQHHQETSKISESQTKLAKQQQQQQSSSVEQRSRCAQGFEYSGELDSCYRLTGDRTTWRMARQRCRQLNADLAVVDSARHQRYINMKARSNPDTRHCDLWIGLVRGRGGVDASSSSSSSWHWVGDVGNARTPSYTNWNINEPNNANSYEHCTQMLWIFSWRWNDAHCNYGNACYVCQAKAAPPA